MTRSRSTLATTEAAETTGASASAATKGHCSTSRPGTEAGPSTTTQAGSMPRTAQRRVTLRPMAQREARRMFSRSMRATLPA